MAILSLVSESAGLAGVQPRTGHMVSTDTLEKILTPGYINNDPSSQGVPLSNGDFLSVIYGASTESGGRVSGGTPILVSLNIPTNGVITLEIQSNQSPDFIQDVTPGVSAPGKALSLDEDSKLDDVSISNIELAGTNAQSQPKNLTTVSAVPASGSCTASFLFTNGDSQPLEYILPIFYYLSDEDGKISSAVDSVAAATEGSVMQIVNGQFGFAQTSDTDPSLLSMTFTGDPGTYYCSFMFPNGRAAVSQALVINA